MPTYVLMTKLSPELVKNPKKLKAIGDQLGKKIRQECPKVKWICHYALLGPYDFLDIYEAPNEEVAAKVSLLTMSAGVHSAESWTAIPYDRFVRVL